MDWLNSLANTLNIACVIRKCAINLGKTRCRENYIGMVRRFGLEKLLNDNKVFARKHASVLKAAADQQCFRTLNDLIDRFSARGCIVGANRIVVFRERVE